MKCKENRAVLHVARFVSGSEGRCIKHEDQWVTPQEFEIISGGAGKKSLDNIQTDYGPLKTLTATGMLKSNGRSLRGKKSEAADEGEGEHRRRKTRTSRRGKEDEVDQEDDENNDGDADTGDHDVDEDRDDDDEDGNDGYGNGNDKHYEDDEDEAPETTEASTYTGPMPQIEMPTASSSSGKSKKKKKKHRDAWKRQLETQLKNETMSQAAGMSSVEDQPPYIQDHETEAQGGILLHKVVGQPMDHPPKISPSVIGTSGGVDPLHQQPVEKVVRGRGISHGVKARDHGRSLGYG